MNKLEYYLNLPYKIKVECIPECDGGGYCATIPELGKYAFVGDGDTEAAAIEDLKICQRERFEYYIKNDIAIPEPISKEHNNEQSD
jgi:predicted RNase H-like HicB family nuclease